MAVFVSLSAASAIDMRRMSAVLVSYESTCTGCPSSGVGSSDTLTSLIGHCCASEGMLMSWGSANMNSEQNGITLRTSSSKAIEIW
eukprot:992354-Rhodomonas_salina.3